MQNSPSYGSLHQSPPLAPVKTSKPGFTVDKAVSPTVAGRVEYIKQRFGIGGLQMQNIAQAKRGITIARKPGVRQSNFY